MNLKKTVVCFFAVGLLCSCATESGIKPQSWAKAVQTADSREAHLRLAEHYDEIAQTLEVDAQEEREMLQEYLARPWKYGKRIQSLKSQASDMVRDLEMAAKESRQLAEYHRQMADEAP